MSNWRDCPLCGEYDDMVSAGLFRHRCKPAWAVCGSFDEFWRDYEWPKVHARDSETAAEKHCERYDCEGGEYSIVSTQGYDTYVYVIPWEKYQAWEDDGMYGPLLPEVFSISAESLPHYYGHKES